MTTSLILVVAPILCDRNIRRDARPDLLYRHIKESFTISAKSPTLAPNAQFIGAILAAPLRLANNAIFGVH
jgi:hypothetical protein